MTTDRQRQLRQEMLKHLYGIWLLKDDEINLVKFSEDIGSDLATVSHVASRMLDGNEIVWRAQICRAIGPAGVEAVEREGLANRNDIAQNQAARHTLLTRLLDHEDATLGSSDFDVAGFLNQERISEDAFWAFTRLLRSEGLVVQGGNSPPRLTHAGRLRAQQVKEGQLEGRGEQIEGGRKADGTANAMMEHSRMDQTIQIFFAYSRKDELLRNELAVHLTTLKRQGLIEDWHDRRIEPGQEWDRVIDEHLNCSQIILLLISADFIASDYCFSVEMKRALERHEEGDARVIPIILRPCDWITLPFGKLQALPKDGKPVTTWINQDEAFTDIAHGIRLCVESMIKSAAKQIQSEVLPPTSAPLSSELFQKRFWQAILAVGFAEMPTLVLAAYSCEACEVKSLFESRQSEIVRLIEDPPKLWLDGFNLDTGQPSKIVPLDLRRTVNPGYKLLEMWRDGLVVFVAPGDHQFLCHSTESDTSSGCRINNLVLAEATLLFATLAAKVFSSFAAPQPKRFRLSLILRGMNLEGGYWSLNPHPVGTAGWRLNMENGVNHSKSIGVYVEAPTSGSAEEAALRLLQEFYLQFGFEHDRVPYAEGVGKTARINPELIRKR